MRRPSINFRWFSNEKGALEFRTAPTLPGQTPIAVLSARMAVRSDAWTTLADVVSGCRGLLRTTGLTTHSVPIPDIFGQALMGGIDHFALR